MNGPVFIVGVGRSGTSLVQSMIASHPDVFLPPETGFVRRYLVPKTLTRRRVACGTEAAIGLLGEDQRLERWDIDWVEIARECLREDGLWEADVFTHALRKSAADLGRTVVGDKDPKLVEYLPILAAIWPDARIIHVLRDCRDVLASKKRAAWSRARPVALHALANRAQRRLGRCCGQSLGPRYLEVRYEELLGDPPGNLKRICSFLGLSYEPEMLEFSGTSRRLVADEERAWKRETLGPLLTTNKGKWRVRLSDPEAYLSRATCPDPEDLCRDDPHLGPALAKLVSAPSVAAVLLLDPIYRWHRQRMIDRFLADLQ